jgi:hemerythrin-like metal-binding protein
MPVAKSADVQGKHTWRETSLGPCPEQFMAAFNWNSSYSVNVKRCDEDHKKLFALINDLHGAMQSGKGNQVIEKVVQELEDYTRFHFAGEEALMAKTQYPGLVAHQVEHQKFVQALVKLRKEGITGQSISLLAFLNDWLINHIKRIDQRYSAHLNANGVA